MPCHSCGTRCAELTSGYCQACNRARLRWLSGLREKYAALLHSSAPGASREVGAVIDNYVARELAL